MITRFSIFDSLPKNSGQKIEGISTKVSARFCNNFVSKRIIFSYLQGINCFLVEISRRETTSDVQKTHLMPILSTNYKAFSSKQYCLSESWRSMHSWSTMEMDTLEFDSHIFNLFHSVMNFLSGINIISKLAWKRSSKFIRSLFLDSYSPKDLHFRSELFDFN